MDRAADSCVLGFGSMCKQTGFLSGKGLSGEIKEVCFFECDSVYLNQFTALLTVLIVLVWSS